MAQTGFGRAMAPSILFVVVVLALVCFRSFFPGAVFTRSVSQRGVLARAARGFS